MDHHASSTETVADRKLRRTLTLGAMSAVVGLALACVGQRELATCGIALIGLGAILSSVAAASLTAVGRTMQVHDVVVHQQTRSVPEPSEATDAEGPDSGNDSAINRGEPFTVDLDFSALQDLLVEKARCRVQLEECQDGLYATVFQTELRGGLDHRECRAGTRLVCKFEGTLPDDRPNTSTDHRWTIHVDVETLDSNDYEAAREITVS